MSKVPFKYFAYWDVPRWIVCKPGGAEVLLASEFDQEPDDYPPIKFPQGWESDGPAWKHTVQPNWIGQIRVDSIECDDSKRKELVDAPLIELLNKGRIAT